MNITDLQIVLAREREALAQSRSVLADVIQALEKASKCNAEELRATCPGNGLTRDEWAALWMARAILEFQSPNTGYTKGKA